MSTRGGHLADLVDDPAGFLSDPNADIRRLAVSACSSRLDDESVVRRLTAMATEDSHPRVRAEAVEVVAAAGSEAFAAAMAATGDPEAIVVEAAATALGEIEDARAVDTLVGLATQLGESMVREAAVAALGAIGDNRALSTLLDLVSGGPPQVRRRCVAALTVFDDPRAVAAIKAARNDRNPMVKEAALMAVGYED